MANPLRAHWILDPEIVFLNHGSFGACPKPVLVAQQALRERLEREPVLFLGRELEARVDAARAELAPFVGADPEDIVPVSNATTGVNAVLESIELGAGDELLLTNHGYNACRNAAERAAKRAGAKVVVADVPFPLRSEDEVVQAVLVRASPRTRLALIDHVTSPTGLVFPIERLVRELAKRGIDTLVDAAHAPGMVAVDIRALDPAYYTGNLHKWVCAPKGAAFLYVRRDLQPRVRPPVISHGANSPRTDRSRFHLEFDFTGTDDPTAFLVVPECLHFLGGLFPGGWNELRRRNRELALKARTILYDALAIDEPAPESMIGTLAAVPIPPLKPGERPDRIGIDPLQRTLFEQHHIEVPIMPFPAPPRRVLRVSAQAYNEVGEYETLARQLRQLVPA